MMNKKAKFNHNLSITKYLENKFFQRLEKLESDILSKICQIIAVLVNYSAPSRKALHDSNQISPNIKIRGL